MSRIYPMLLIPVVLVIVGTAGYHWIEGWQLFDSLYMATITLTTVGFMEVQPLTHAGRAFTIGLALCGVFTLFYAASAVVGFVATGHLQTMLGRKRMERSLAKLRDHVVVCGYGRMGYLVCRELDALKQPFVVIDTNEKAVASFAMPFGIALHGDATSDDVLRRAAVDRARALVSVVASDADNLYITMSARLLSDRLFIVARAEDETAAERKLLRAGASRVVSPYKIGGHRMALAVVRPTVMDFWELATRSEHLELQIEETQVGEGSPLAGKSLADSRVRQELGLIVVAIKKPSGKMVFNPEPDMLIHAQDILITLGHRERLDRLETIARG